MSADEYDIRYSTCTWYSIQYSDEHICYCTVVLSSFYRSPVPVQRAFVVCVVVSRIFDYLYLLRKFSWLLDKEYCVNADCTVHSAQSLILNCSGSVDRSRKWTILRAPSRSTLCLVVLVAYDVNNWRDVRLCSNSLLLGIKVVSSACSKGYRKQHVRSKTIVATRRSVKKVLKLINEDSIAPMRSLCNGWFLWSRRQPAMI